MSIEDAAVQNDSPGAEQLSDAAAAGVFAIEGPSNSRERFNSSEQPVASEGRPLAAALARPGRLRGGWVHLASALGRVGAADGRGVCG